MIKNAICLFCFAIIVLFIFIPSYSQMQDLKQKTADYEAEITYLQKEKLALEKEKRRLKEDPMYLEKVAREKMGLIKENEVVYQITPILATEQ